MFWTLAVAWKELFAGARTTGLSESGESRSVGLTDNIHRPKLPHGVNLRR